MLSCFDWFATGIPQVAVFIHEASFMQSYLVQTTYTNLLLYQLYKKCQWHFALVWSSICLFCESKLQRLRLVVKKRDSPSQ